jgi:hypothetical protein
MLLGYLYLYFNIIMIMMCNKLCMFAEYNLCQQKICTCINPLTPNDL